jgi:glycosyltransferase involved in cell wall biosynthesis
VARVCDSIDYSIVIPAYNESGIMTTMDAIFHEVIACNPTFSCEVIFIDDGSESQYLEKLLDVREKYPQLVKIIKLTRNFGQTSARHAGFSHAKGKCVVSISADRQDPAVLINLMLKAHFDEGFEIVACRRSGRDESYYRILTSKIFYGLMRTLSFKTMPTGGFDFFLLGRKALDTILRNREAHPFVQGQILWTGFKIKFIDYRRERRKEGHSHWTFSKKLTRSIDGVLSYSFLPIRLMSLTGLVVAFLGFLYATIIVVGKLTVGNPIQGWASLIIVILIIGGFQMLMLGIIGEYLWRTLAQVRNRDPYVIEAISDNVEPTTQRLTDNGHDGSREVQPKRFSETVQTTIANQ